LVAASVGLIDTDAGADAATVDDEVAEAGGRTGIEGSILVAAVRANGCSPPTLPVDVDVAAIVVVVVAAVAVLLLDGGCWCDGCLRGSSGRDEACLGGGRAELGGDDVGDSIGDVATFCLSAISPR
jgi:hypothetical protein